MIVCIAMGKIIEVLYRKLHWKLQTKKKTAKLKTNKLSIFKSIELAAN